MSGRMRARTWRLPALAVFAVLLVAASVVGRQRPSLPAVSTRAADLVMPVATDAAALRSTWFCAGAPGRAGAPAQSSGLEHLITIANTSDRALSATITGIPAEGNSGVLHVDLAARSTQEVPVAGTGTPTGASALVEADGGLVSVLHTLRGPTGRAAAPCASSTATAWFFPVGTTRLGAHQQFSIFNPFPDQAVVDFSFQTDEGLRESDKLRGIVVPPRRTAVVDITDTITVRKEIATAARVRSGRAVIDQIVSTDGSNGTPKSLSLLPGAPAVSDAWFFPDSPAVSAGVEQHLVVYNPGRDAAEVEVQVRLDDETPETAIPPFQLRVRGGQYGLVNLSQDDRVPPDRGFWALASVRAGPGIVAARVVRSSGGVTATLGSPLVAPRWQLPAGTVGDATTRLAIVNPSPADAVSITIRVVRAGKVETLARFDGVSLAARSRTTIDVPPDVPARAALIIEASSAVVVEQRLGFGALGVSSFMGIPVVTGATAPGPDVVTAPDIGLTPGTLDINQLGSIPGTAAPGGSVVGSAPTGTIVGAAAPTPLLPAPTATTAR